MSPMRLLFGVLSMVLGVVAFLGLMFASALRHGFGAEPVPWAWFAIPVLIGLGGPAYFWIVLPYRDKLRARLRQRR